MAQKMVICDTNIMIEFFKGNPETTEDLRKIGFKNIGLSSITFMELYQGMDNKRELNQIVRALLPYKRIDINRQASKLATEYLKRYYLSHSLQIPDAIIAATAIAYNLELFTYNIKDFQFIPSIKLYKK
ncbi:MAG: type II toxin-antitoxin system VapC family toxin [Chitinophagales bacterium]